MPTHTPAERRKRRGNDLIGQNGQGLNGGGGGGRQLPPLRNPRLPAQQAPVGAPTPAQPQAPGGGFSIANLLPQLRNPRLPAQQAPVGAPTPAQPQAPVGAPTPANLLPQPNVTTGGSGRVDVPQIAPQPNQPGVPIDPNDSLRSQAFLPPTDVSLDPATQRARTLVSGQLENLQGPDRQQLALDAFQRLRESTQPQFQSELRDVGRRAATLGRIGAGMTTSDLGDVEQRREEFLGRAQAGLSGEAAGLSLQDRLASLGGLRGGAGTLAGLGDTEFGRGVQQRGELRGERGFQDQLANQALDRRVQQELLERGGQSQDFEQDLARRQFIAGIGGSQPISPFASLYAANQLGPTSDPFSTFSDIASRGGSGGGGELTGTGVGPGVPASALPPVNVPDFRAPIFDPRRPNVRPLPELRQ